MQKNITIINPGWVHLSKRSAYGGLHNYQVHRIVFLLPCSLLPAPCSLKTQNESTSPNCNPLYGRWAR
ncbi:hypothetical protein [Moorena sp. SIO4G3]|uniref:hypothetical protein n=1 Tax=Moorena sp. SIO4G3 TaxID=2607821 RepID=UPI00142B2809|nr:hypothetical protein [Moorena sp. SIO4G3]NEO82340.1 hypothetical protein [Moorena sp. SIO4G3]